uniref:Uncharacterized protein n=1 Tax=Glossina pallidipes TaxID=7398 RepID=A0A1A9ZWD0_GLOPL
MRDVNEGVVNEASVTSNENYNWDDDDNDLFLSISTQEILDQNDFPSTSKGGHKFPVNKQITQSNQKASGERPELKEGVNEMFTENEWKEMKIEMHQDEVVNNPVSAGFETANGKKISISEAGKKSVQNILREFQGNLQETDYETEIKDIKARISMESKFRKTANSSAQIKTGFQANTKKGFQDCLQEKQDKNTGSGSSNRDVGLLSLNRKYYLKIIKDRMASKGEKPTSSSKEEDRALACKSTRKFLGSRRTFY